ncbi:MAG: bifunctional DNA primase/polymerase [Planctomycetaceae bacterium]
MARMPVSRLQDVALRLADLGYAVFPCASGTKKPITPHGCNDATSDLDQVEQWWQQYPSANIGISTRGLLVVDIDAGSNWLNEDPQRSLDLAIAPLSLTARSGRQYFFRQPANVSWKNTNSQVAKFVDIKVDGGYVIAPPSVLEGQRRYRWAPSMELDVGPEQLPLPPAWLIDELNQLSANTADQSRSGTLLANAIPAGQRNGTLARLAGTMRRAGMSVDEITAAIQETNRLRCQPPMDRDEVDRIASSVGRYEPDQINVATIENHFEQNRRATDEPIFKIVTSRDLDASQYDMEYLISGILVRGQPSMIAGPKKTLKTNISIDLALSLAEATPFLGKFDVQLSRRVGVMSGESGAATIQETARRVATSKQLQLAECSGAVWCFDVPQLTNQLHLDGMKRVIEDHALDVLILDPTYLMMLGLGNDAANLFIVGGLLKAIGELAQETGCTPILCHHLKKSIAEPYEPAELENIAWAGFQEFVRQWILLNRRVRYDPDHGGHHELWMSVGGSAGHSGLWGIDIDEGIRDDPGGRRWDVSVLDAGDAFDKRDALSESQTEERQERRKQSKFDRNKQRIVEVLAGAGDGESLRGVCTAAGMRDRTAKEALEMLVDEGVVETCECKKGRSKFTGYRLVSNTGQQTND